MTEWEMTYTEDKENYDMTVVSAPTYTMAVLEFVMRFPNCECTGVSEINAESL